MKDNESKPAEMTVYNAMQVVAEKKAQIAKIGTVLNRSRDQLALMQGAAGGMIESGELDADQMQAIHNVARDLKEIFAAIELDTQMD